MKYVVAAILVVAVLGSRIDYKSEGKVSPKFKVGDCIADKSDIEQELEFLDNHYIIRRIIKVGQKNYLYELGYSKTQNEFSIDSLDRSSVKVVCPPEL